MRTQESKYGPRLKLFLCYSSSEDVAYPTVNLRNQTKFCCGWQSSKACSYPQELGFTFEGQVFLNNVRLLLHESKIPSLVKISVADACEAQSKNAACVPYESATFVDLSDVPISNNELSKHMARELKVVDVRRTCTYLKLLFMNPHPNAYNLLRKVGLVAISAHGHIVQTFGQGHNVKRRLHQGLLQVGEIIEVPLEEMLPISMAEFGSSNSLTGNITTSISFQQFNPIEVLRPTTVVHENHNVATEPPSKMEEKYFKAPIELLECDKAKAIVLEDYELAKMLKKKTDALQHLNSQTLASLQRTLQGNCNSAIKTQIKNLDSKSEINVAKDSIRRGESDSSISELKSVMRCNESTDVKVISYDDIVAKGKGYYDTLAESNDVSSPIPHTDNSNLRKTPEDTEASTEIPLDGNGQSWEKRLNAAIACLLLDQRPPSFLMREVAEEAKKYEDDLGVYAVGCLLSRRGQLRELALRAISSEDGYNALLSHTSTAIETLLAYLSTKGHGLEDAFSGMFFESCQFLQKWIAGELKQAPSLSQLDTVVSKLLEQLVNRLADTNSKIRKSAEGLILSFARSSYGPEKVISMLIRTDKKPKRLSNSYALSSNIKILSTFLDDYGVDVKFHSHALNTQTLLSHVVLPSLQNSNCEVRDAAIKMFAKLITLDEKVCKPCFDAIKPAQQALVERHLKRLNMSDLVSGFSCVTKVKDNSISTMDIPCTSDGGRTIVASDKKSEKSLESSNKMNTSGIKDEFILTHTCQFCTEFSRDFNNKNLDLHYAYYCPMLCPCPLCDQVTEISTLQEHIVAECEGRSFVRQCPRCREAVRVEDFKSHLARKDCIEATSTHSVCPLCHKQFANSVSEWRKHLARAPGCPNNPRSYDGSGSVNQAYKLETISTHTKSKKR